MEPMDHPYQLRSIELRNFKSVGHAAVELRPLSVIVGANSAGKSTLIQAVLATAQAVRVETDAAEFPLNGEFVRLGTFDEMRNFHATDRDSLVVLKFGLRDETEWELHLAGGPVPDSGTARVTGLRISGKSVPSIRDGEARSTVEATILDIAEVALAMDSGLAPPSDFVYRQFGGFRSIAETNNLVRVSGRVVEHADGKPSEEREVLAAVLDGGLPESMYSSIKWIDLLSRMWWETAMHTSFGGCSYGGDIKGTVFREGIVQIAIRDISEELLTEPSSEQDTGAWMRDVINRVCSRLRTLLEDIAGDDDELADDDYHDFGREMQLLGEDEFQRLIRTEFESFSPLNQEVLVGDLSGSNVVTGRARSDIANFFEDDVQYLGPLREAPQVLYDPGPTKRDLGNNGEFTAAVLRSQASTTIQSPTLDSDAVETDLATAVNYWLEHLGLAKAALSDDRGRIGIGLRVNPIHADRSVDLTSVGVGVSQVLPVILLCLLSQPGTLVILEQPELHLHPAMQQKLADFFLACVRSGRQLLIETHSEHMVNRLRRRVVEDDTDETRDLVGLLFAEQRNGITQYRSSEINSLGGLDEDWPEGFLDLGAREAQSLMRTSLEKRRRVAGRSSEDE